MSAETSFSPSAWEKIRACGERVEATLASKGVVLTMGGEPTFIPKDPQGAEWHTAALGPTKLGYARKFARQLIEASYPGALVLETSGKHYPGEPLPRWALLVQWRADGKTLWRDSARLRGDATEGTHTLAQARSVIEALAQKLSVPRSSVLEAHHASAGNTAAGYVLPLDHDGSRWISDDWTAALREPAVKLFPGDSLIGLRLPMGLLGEKNLRRALTVELREGALTIFVPPLLVEAYCDLVGAIEAVFEEQKIFDAVLAGYAPPLDPRLPTIGFASDPGVIEVNLAICENWVAYDRQLAQLYAAAEKCGLVARKLQHNGRETGTGGGAHLVFGGPLGLDSPFFAFPALLPSVIRYFQHHPALSYAFTGQYMGPSSQAPRIDESTFEAMYELEIACEGAERFGSRKDYALFDLLFRDLLMDRSGNTHRAEISVDKLWNPFAGNGRAGLVELRAFETHPDREAMSVVALFVRAIFARLATNPFKAPFVRWGTELHDKFFLPSFVWRDLSAICDDLRLHAIPFDEEWLRPLWEFRFPKLGELPASAEEGAPVAICRQALEAWPLLGEQPIGGGGTARSVDASMDRIEILLSDGAVLAKKFLLVNGFPCRFSSLDNAAAAGVRYRAFYLLPALHPHIEVHAPLLIEWVDRETSCVTAAGRWHVWNPTNVPYENRPATREAAVERFQARWENWPQTIGEKRSAAAVIFPPESRYTLDLRRT